MLTHVHGGLAPQQQLQALGLVEHAAVVQGRVPLGRLLVQVPTEKPEQREKRLPLQPSTTGEPLTSGLTTESNFRPVYYKLRRFLTFHPNLQATRDASGQH